MSTREKIRQKFHLVNISEKSAYQILYSLFFIRIVFSFICWFGYFVEAIILAWFLEFLDGEVLVFSGYPTDKRYKRFDWLTDFLSYGNITLYAATIWKDWSLLLILMLAWKIVIMILREKDKRMIFLNPPFMKLVTLRALIPILLPSFIIDPKIIVAGVFIVNPLIEYFIHFWK